MPGNNNYRVSGAFFENDRGTGPAFTGFIEIDGQKTFIALWPKTSAKGVNYFQVSEDKKKQQGQQPSTAAPRSPFNRAQQPRQPKRDPDDPFGDGGDSIPF